ncbi:MAG TPA: hypothetical protein DDZ99_06145 [Clostridiales bacterium]|nr:hypothetical protein [Clostridiales bacterium]
MKKSLSLFLLIVILFSSSMFTSISVSAEPMYDSYMIFNGAYEDYYEDVYKPAYNSYNEALNEFRTELHALDDSLTRTQYYQIIAFLNQVIDMKKSLFGDRETVGSSRYEVPRLREAMYAAADAGSYDEAISLCNNLTGAIHLRVDCLNTLKAALENYTFPAPVNP